MRSESGVLGTPRQTMAAGPRISRLFLWGSPSGREGSERKPGDSEILGGRDPDSPAASRPKGGTGRRVLWGEDPLWPLAARALPPQLWPLGDSASSPARCEERWRAGPRLDPRRPASAPSPHLRPQPRTRSHPRPGPPPYPRLALSPPGKRPRDRTAWPPPGSRPRRIPELQPETRSWAPAAGRAVTSEPRAPAPDPTSRLRLRRGRRHVRPPGAGARSRGAAPGASCPFLVSAPRPSPRPTGWTLVARRAQASCSWREKRERRRGKGEHGARPPAFSVALRGASSAPLVRGPGSAPSVGRPGPKASRPPPLSFQTWPRKQTRLGLMSTVQF